MDNRLIKVMLVGDDENGQVILRDILAESAIRQFDFDVASHWREALEKAKQNSYDIFLSADHLSEQNGIELMDVFHQKGLKPPLIFLTAKGTQVIGSQTINAGADGYLNDADRNPKMTECWIRYARERSKRIEELLESKKRFQALSVKLVEAQENERKRVAQELHDSIGASLTAVKYALESKLDHMKNPHSSPDGISLEQIISIVRDTIEEARRISANLRPSILDDVGILKTVDWICRKFQEVYPHIRIKKQIACKENNVPEPLKIVICRVLQEALNNASKHSGAKRVEISMKKTQAGLELKIDDDGRGFDVSAAYSKENPGGMGLCGMRDRTALSKGLFEIFSKQGKGTRVRAFWPMRS